MENYKKVYCTPQDQPQIIYVWHKDTGRPLFTLPQGDFKRLAAPRPQFIVVDLRDLPPSAFHDRLPMISEILLGQRDLPVQFLDGHDGSLLSLPMA